MKCSECRHYSFYVMITGGPYGYSGEIPCLKCSRFSYLQDRFEPSGPNHQNAADAEEPGSADFERYAARQKVRSGQMHRGEQARVEGMDEVGELIGSNSDGTILHVKMIDLTDGRARVIDAPVDSVKPA